MVYMVYDCQMSLRCVVQDWDTARGMIEDLVAGGDAPLLQVYRDIYFCLDDGKQK